MPNVLFNWPGGKSKLAPWILDHAPQHECYVEVFGGSAGLLLNKETSDVEVYNDLDSDIVQFFNVYKEHTQELVDWLKKRPYSREVYEKYAQEYYHDDYRPDDPIERAGRFFYLRYTQFGSKYSSKSGFGTSKVQNQAQTYANKRDNLLEFSERFDSVTIENDDWSVIVDRYDGENTWFYCDPPYIGTEGYYVESEFSHRNFINTMGSIEGYVTISYDNIPEFIDDSDYILIQEENNTDGEYQWWITTKESRNYIDSGVKGETKDTTEVLLMNYNPDSVGSYDAANQSGLMDFGSEETQDDTGGFLDNVAEE